MHVRYAAATLAVVHQSRNGSGSIRGTTVHWCVSTGSAPVSSFLCENTASEHFQRSLGFSFAQPPLTNLYF